MIQLYGTIKDPAGSPVPGAIIELRALSTTDEVLLGSVLTYKCDPAGSYRFPLAVGSYDVYAQNDLCGDMDYLGTGYVTAQSQDGSLNSILLDSGVEITPPMIERALNAMIKSESAARTTEQNRVITNQDRQVTEEASRMAVEIAQAVQANASTVNIQAMAIEQASQVVALQAGSTETAKVAVEQMHREVITNASSIAKAVAATEINANSAEMAAQTAEGAKSVVVETAEQVDRLEGVMAAHSVMVQDRVVEVTTQVRNLASLASVVQLIASNVAHAQNVINEMRDQVAANAVLAQSAAKTATDNANMTTEHQLATSSSERHAKFAEMMAEAWAQNPEDIAINGRPGEFSALHWALQAQKWAQSITSAGGVEAVGHGNFSDLFIRSDERSQTNVTPITDALAKVKQLQGCLRDISGQRQAGLVAQHIADVQPESVFINRDGLLSFSSSGVFALLVEALKELDGKLEGPVGTGG